MGVSATNHRRTLSSISSNVNPGFQLENDELHSLYELHRQNSSPQPHHHSSIDNRMRVYENVPFKSQNEFLMNYFPKASQDEAMVTEHPVSLPFDHSKLRSSLKKYTINASVRLTPNGSGNLLPQRTMSAVMAGPTASTIMPTNPTPPDSLTSDDSSYLSAKEGSISSQSRVRFSPETLLEQMNQPPTQYVNTATQFVQGTPIRRLSRTRHSISDMYTSQSPSLPPSTS